MTYIALLRGINVVGKKIVRMKDLSHMFESMKFRNVRTYLQSGNVIFESPPTAPQVIAKKIGKKVEEKFGFPVSVILRTPDEMKKLIAANPLLKDKTVQRERLHVTFLSTPPDGKTISALDMKKEPNEKFIIKGREIYLYCPNGYGVSKLNNNTFEKKLNTTATTRNWNTTTKLLELSTTTTA